MTNIEKLIEKYGIEVVKRIPEEHGDLTYTMIYGVQISMSELIEHLKTSEYIASYKHLIGCEVSVYNYSKVIFDVWKHGVCIDDDKVHWDNPYMRHINFYLDDETLGTYEEYMQLHYPEYEQIWRKQL